MQLNSAVRATLLALPVLALTACCSSKKSVEKPVEEAVPPVTLEAAPLTLEGTAYPEVDEQVQQLEVLKNRNLVYFDFDKNNITSEFAQILDEHAAFLRDNPTYKVLVEGHADERGTPEYNIALGERRANAVAMYLQGSGVSEQQITIVSYGQERPVDLGHSAEAHAKNRRAVLVY